jgi:hypothetical protein
MRRPCLFKERDVTRAAKAVRKAGLEVARVEINRDGVIVVVPGKPETPIRADQINDNGAVPNALDRELVEFEERHGQG